MAKELERALRTLNRSPLDLAGSLESLLDAWRGERHPSVSRLIDDLTARIADQQDPFVDSKPREWVPIWVARVRTGGIEYGLALPALRRIAEQTTWGRIYPCFAALAALPPDPRVGRFAAEFLATPTYEVNTRNAKFWTCLGRMLATHGDAAALELVAELVWANENRRHPLARLKRYVDGLRKLLDAPMKTPPPKLLEQIEAAIASLPDAELEAGLARFAAASSSKDSAGQLIASIYLEPSDIGCRLVLSDWLQEHGDSDRRGEFIALQCAADPTPEADKRAASLLKKHRKKWLGPLAELVVLKSLRWERGFPVEADLRALKAAQVRTECNHREWATFETLRFSHAAQRGQTFASPEMRAIRRLDNLCEVGLAQAVAVLAESNLQSLGANTWFGSDFELSQSEGWTALVESTGFSSLVELGLGYGGRPESLEWLWTTPLALRLRSLRTGWYDFPGLERWVEVLARLPLLDRVEFSSHSPYAAAVTISGLRDETRFVYRGGTATGEGHVAQILALVRHARRWDPSYHITINKWGYGAKPTAFDKSIRYSVGNQPLTLELPS